MDEMEIFSYLGRRFLCSGEQLPSGSFQAVVRYKASPEDVIRTLALDSGQHSTAAQALAWAKELAMKWVRQQDLIALGQGEDLGKVGKPEPD
jgi:hypothetical protein